MQGKVKRSADIIIHVGIDVSKDWLDVAIEPINSFFRVHNSKKGHKEINKRLADFSVDLIVVEATGKFHHGVHRFLHEVGYKIAVVNPYRSRKFSDAVGLLAKTDVIDAKVLAKYAALLSPEPRPLPSKSMMDLREFVRVRDTAVADLTALKNRICAAESSFVKAELRRQKANVERHMKRMEAAIAKLIAENPVLLRRFEILKSMPGVGAVVAMGFLGGCWRWSTNWEPAMINKLRHSLVLLR